MRHRSHLLQSSALRLSILFLIASLVLAGCQPAPAETSAPSVAPATAAPAILEPSPTPETPATGEPAAIDQTTATAEPSRTPEPTPPQEPTATSHSRLPELGGADQIAFFSGGEIWTANIDGSALTQLTQDGAPKTNLRWLPDGEGLAYISRMCLQTVSLAGVADTITCFNSARLFESFEISPDGQRLALSLDSQLYLIPFDLEALSTIERPSELQTIATCADLAPYRHNTARFMRWSADSQSMAAIVLGKLKSGYYADVIQVFDVNKCAPNPLIRIRFPDQYFTYIDYNRNPKFQDFAWDGHDQFILQSRPENVAFSAIHIFNITTFEFTENLNPLDGACCYRDPQFSPDGAYLAFAFQETKPGASRDSLVTQLYYIPIASIGSGTTYQPLPIPEITDPFEQPQPVLRPAQP